MTRLRTGVELLSKAIENYKLDSSNVNKDEMDDIVFEIQYGKSHMCNHRDGRDGLHIFTESTAEEAKILLELIDEAEELIDNHKDVEEQVEKS